MDLNNLQELWNRAAAAKKNKETDNSGGIVHICGDRPVFEAVAKSLQNSIPSGYVLVLGYNLIKYTYESVHTLYPNHKIIVYQLEQLYNNTSRWYNNTSTDPSIQEQTNHVDNWLKKADKIWEYDLDNLEFLNSLGYEATYRPLKYSENIKRLKRKVDRSIDVLFYGSMNDRRKQIIQHIEKLGYKVKTTICWGEQLWNFIQRSKLVLNCHYYEIGIQEQVRIFELLSNDTCVLSEKSRRNYFGDLITEFDNMKDLEKKLKYLIDQDGWKLYENISEKYKTYFSDNQLINILTRTSGRPSYFKYCRQSIRQQTHHNYRHIISLDNKQDKYLNGIKHIKVIPMRREDSSLKHGEKFAYYNLYLNELLKEVEDGWIMILDDDDAFLKPDALKIITKHITSDDDLLLWKVQFPKIIIPPDKYWKKEPVINNISMIGFCFHSKWKSCIGFDYYTAADYRVIHRLWEIIPNKIWIDDILTGIQRNQGMGGGGKRDDLYI